MPSLIGTLFELTQQTNMIHLYQTIRFSMTSLPNMVLAHPVVLQQCLPKQPCCLRSSSSKKAHTAPSPLPMLRNGLHSLGTRLVGSCTNLARP